LRFLQIKADSCLSNYYKYDENNPQKSTLFAESVSSISLYFNKSKNMKFLLLIIIFLIRINSAFAQDFYFGADMSYINEMEDCGVIFHENEEAKEAHEIFKNHNCNLVRLRLWHTPDWHDNLNDGKRYSDLSDVKISIAKAKKQGMNVLLDFHFSDNWADPKHQVVPDAWANIVDDLDILKDSLYQYVYSTLTVLNKENLLPEMVQIGNETNKGILQSEKDNETWKLDWERNAILFNQGIKAVRDFEKTYQKSIKIMLHAAAPENTEWLIEGFQKSGITDFDIIGISYYWAWHKPTSIKETGAIVRNLRATYPEKEVIIVETGYIWTTKWNDNAANIISATHPDYEPASPQNQRDWLIDMTQEVIKNGAKGVVYWEPCWVSSPCSTRWGQGSHQEHATFFDFENNLLLPGGIEWMTHDYDFNVNTGNSIEKIVILTNSFSGDITIQQNGEPSEVEFTLMNSANDIIITGIFSSKTNHLKIDKMPFGVYTMIVKSDEKPFKKVFNYNPE
jgi:arabinogalactan endo-1,4-beta-galactosidase